MIEIQLLNQTAQNLNIGSKIVPGRRYLLGVVGTSTNFDVQYNTPSGYTKILSYTNLNPDTGFLQVEIAIALADVRLAFQSDPGTYHVYITEIKEQH